MTQQTNGSLAEAVEAIDREYRGYRESETDGSSEDTLEDWFQALADVTLTYWPVIKGFLDTQIGGSP